MWLLLTTFLISLLQNHDLQRQKKHYTKNLLKTNTIYFHFRGYRMSALFLELARTVLFLSHIQIEDDLLNG